MLLIVQNFVRKSKGVEEVGGEGVGVIVEDFTTIFYLLYTKSGRITRKVELGISSDQWKGNILEKKTAPHYKDESWSNDLLGGSSSSKNNNSYKFHLTAIDGFWK